MGTDIHLSAEKQLPDGTWEFVPGPIESHWQCDGRYRRPERGDPEPRPGQVLHRGGKFEGQWRPCSCSLEPVMPALDDPDFDWKISDFNYDSRHYVPDVGMERVDWYHDRNYRVFAVLGNVRNGSGFAGIRTHVAIDPISDNRGIPEDASVESVAGLSNEHSATWVSMEEIMAYDWDQPLHQTGVVSMKEYDTYLRRGSPESWSGDVSGGMVKHIDNAAAAALIKAKEFPDSVYTRINWTVPLRSQCETFLERMKALQMTVGEAPVRLIFDFDS